MPEKLTEKLPEGIEVYDVYEAEVKASQLKWLEILGVFEYDERDSFKMAEVLNGFYGADEIVVEKKTKHGGRGEMDIKPAFKDLSIEAIDGEVHLHFFASAQNPTLNPSLISDALAQKCPELAPDFAKFTRVQGYFADMKVFR